MITADARILTAHDASPEAAIEAIRMHHGPLLLDLDETLYLRNSTEDFIDSACPRLAALLLLRVLDSVAPWRWTGGETTRDLWRVRMVSICLPWTVRRWRRRVGALAATFGNLRLMTALRAAEVPPIIATTGFQPIVAPLLAALGLPQVRIIAARLSTFEDRRAGKLQLVVAALGREYVDRALYLTDSSQDLALLDACARPLRVLWPEARYRSALSDIYVPGRYLSGVKRPGTRYIVRGILQEDFAFWVLSSVALAAQPIAHVAGLFFLLVSFWAVYERGYVDNDLIAERFESDPKLSATYADAPVPTPRWQPFIWAAGCGALAIALLRWPQRPVATDLLAWGAMLLGVHCWFRLYNRLDKRTRVCLFGGLQLARSAAFLVLVPVSAIGAMALGAHALSKWVPYYTYRFDGRGWPDAPLLLTRLLFFTLLALLLGFASGASAVLNGTALALFAWNLFRARRELATTITAARRLDRNHKGSPT
jgi:phosphoserine phosphatase